MSDASVSRPHLREHPIRGARMRLGVVGAILVVIIVACAIDPPWVVESLHDLNAPTAVASSANLSPRLYVQSIWTSRVLPTAEHSSVPLTTLLAALKANSSTASKRYGNFPVFDGPPTFLVKAQGHVVSIDTSSIPSTAGVSLGAGHTADVYLQLGPIILGTDVRDAMPFISFGQFENQVKYGEVATAINEKVVATAYAGVDYTTLKHKTVTFTGAFTLTPGTTPLITPITMTVRP